MFSLLAQKVIGLYKDETFLSLLQLNKLFSYFFRYDFTIMDYPIGLAQELNT